jgi:hypothetical protein
MAYGIISVAWLQNKLLAHPQEALHNGTWYIVCVCVCVLCLLAATGLELRSNPGASR